MIQRIQTIFLLLASGAAFALFKLPFATTNEAVEATLYSDKVFNIHDHVALLGLFAGAGALALISIFLFKNRKLQMILTRVALLANIAGLLVAAFFFSNEANKVGEAGLGVYLPVVFVIFGLLALRFIKKDDKLVKSMDRLR
jgi:hypothetical protein